MIEICKSDEGVEGVVECRGHFECLSASLRFVECERVMWRKERSDGRDFCAFSATFQKFREDSIRLNLSLEPQKLVQALSRVFQDSMESERAKGEDLKKCNRIRKLAKTVTFRPTERKRAS